VPVLDMALSICLLTSVGVEQYDIAHGKRLKVSSVCAAKRFLT